jgi:uroporphyrinogen-III synthase
MIEGLGDEGLAGANVVLQEYGEPSAWAVDALTRCGALVTVVPVYRCTPPADPEPAMRLIDAAVEGRLDAVTFTSPPAVRGLCHLADEAGRGDQLRTALGGSLVAAVGPMTAETLAAVGISRSVAPNRGCLGLMVRCLVDVLSERCLRLDAAGTEVVVQGATLACGDVRTVLSDRERAVLDLLLRRPGAVVSKDVLLRAVWGPAAVDRKLVDSTVGRLRRRLDPVGLAIHSLPRRGYRIEASPVSVA